MCVRAVRSPCTGGCCPVNAQIPHFLPDNGYKANGCDSELELACSVKMNRLSIMFNESGLSSSPVWQGTPCKCIDPSASLSYSF